MELRAGQLLGFVFLIGPVGDLIGSTTPAGRTAAVLACLIAFVALYVILLPPISRLASCTSAYTRKM